MSALLLPPRAVDPAPVAADLIHHVGSRVQPAAHFPLLSTLQWSNPPSPLTDWPTEHTPVASCSKLETLPVEIVNQILSHLTHPRSRLPGLTEAQSAHDFPSKTRSDIKAREDLTTPPDTDRWAADLFNWNALQHPFHALSLTSRRCNQLVESFCAHMVRSCNKFGLPFNQLDQCGSKCVYPDMSGIVYRRLWLQHAPRHCVYCFAVLDCYPFPLLKRVIAACKDCFYRQTLVSNLCTINHDLLLTLTHRPLKKSKCNIISRLLPFFPPR